MKAISDARDTHLSAVMGGSETNCLLDALITDPDFPFVTNIESVIAILKGIYKPGPKDLARVGMKSMLERKQNIIERNSLKKKQDCILLNSPTPRNCNVQLILVLDKDKESSVRQIVISSCAPYTAKQ